MSLPRGSLAKLDRLIRPLHARGLNDFSIAERIGCLRRYVCTRRRAMKLSVNYERWTWRVKPARGHDRTIREMYAGGAFDLEIARAIGVGKRSVSLRRMELGLQTLIRRHPLKKLATHDALIRRRIKHGWSGSEIAAEIGGGCHQREVSARRLFLGLPASGNNERRCRKVAVKTREQLKKAGLPSMAYLRIEKFQQFARERGWPDDLGPRAVQILEALFERGLMHRRQIVVVIGMNADQRQRKWLFDAKNQTSYLSTLMRRGLVVRSTARILLPGTLPGKRKMVGRSVYFYGLTDAARTLKEIWNAESLSRAGRQPVAATDSERRHQPVGRGREDQDHRRRSRRNHRRLQGQGQSRA